jgi:hypothetical protein
MKLTHWEPDLRTLRTWIENDEIDLQPNFQRGDIWSPAKKRKLIDTILRGWSIPPIHVVVTESGTLDVLDGQQRLTAIRDFMSDEFPVDGSIEPHDNSIAGLAGYRYSELPPSVRRAFDQYPLRVFKITEYKPEEPGELFYRLNAPLSLTAGEQRNALYGPARAQLKHIVAEFEKDGNKRETIGFSNARMSYDDVFAKLLFFLERRTFAIRATESSISDRFKLKDPFSSVTINWAMGATTEFSHARAQAENVRLNKATLLSWLLYFARYRNEEPDHGFLSRFERAKEVLSQRSRKRSGEFPWEAGYEKLKGEEFIRLFIDRSSLRVSDISSVVYRDFSLWAVAAINKVHLPRELFDRHDLRDLARIGIGDVSNVEASLDALLNAQEWAKL